MKITRRGSSADHGKSSIEFKTPTIKWKQSDSCIVISAPHIKDFSTASHHSYDVSLSFIELNMLIQSLSEAALSAPESFEKELESSLKALTQIQFVVAGLKT